MSFWGHLGEIASEVAVLGGEIGHVAGSATPFIGTAVNGAKAMYHSSLAHDAEMAHDYRKADHYGSEAAYDWLKAVPVVGTGLGMAELVNGGISAIKGDGFVNGMEDTKDTVKDIGAMLGIKEFGANGYDDWGKHAELRKDIREQETWEEYLAEHPQGS